MEAIVSVSGLILGKEMVVQSISSTSTSILKSVKSITDNYDNETKKLFEILDIKFKLDIIASFIENSHNTNIKLHDAANDAKISTIEHCIHYIKDIMDCIEKEVKLLEEEIAVYKLKWLGNLSYRQFKDQFEKIRTHVAILDNRFDTLIKILK